MKLIKTKSFQLAIITKGDQHSEKLALLLPGRLDTKDYVNFTSHMDCLSEKGFLVVAFDPPGTWDSPGDFEFTTTNYIKSVNEIIDYFGNRQTLLIGHSRGGLTAMLVGTSNTSVIGFALINASYGPPTHPDPGKIKDGYLVEKRDIPPGDIRTPIKKEFQMSLNYFIDGKKYDPLPLLKLCTKPKLLIYGTHDEFTEPQEVKEIFETIPQPKMIYELHCEHDYRINSRTIKEVNIILVKFINTYF